MKRLVFAGVAALVVAVGLVPGRAAAQWPSQFNTRLGQPPTNPQGVSAFSPYLNMGRGGNPGINYYGVVRPQFETQQSIQALQLGQQQLQQDQAALAGMNVLGGYPLMTGHPTQFMNYGTFFPPTVAGYGQRR
jgi:hypothetical protein